MKGERTVEKRRERNTKKTLLDIYSKYGIILILILIMAFLTIRTGGTFIGKNNLLNILKQIACIGVLACGQTAVIIAGGMDLSVGSIVSLVSVLVASTAHPGDFPLIVPIMVGLLTGLVCGLINGLAVAKLKIPPFIVTMSTMTIFAGIALLITKGTPINHFSVQLHRRRQAAWHPCPDFCAAARGPAQLVPDAQDDSGLPHHFGRRQ